MRTCLALCFLLVACGDEATTTPDTAATTTATDTSTPEDTAETTATETVEPPTEVVEDVAVEVEAEVTLTCAERPNPFVYDEAPEAWREPNASTGVSEVDPPNHRGQDVIIKAGEPQVLVAKFAYGFLDQDMKKEDVAIYAQREVPCGEWEYLGEFRTSDDGQYGTTYGFEDDGGRVFFDIPEAKRFGVGRWPIRMVLRGDLTMASFDLIVVEPGTQAIVTDIDGTLTTGDEELLMELLQEAFNETYTQQMYPDADKMIKGYADKGYLIVYMTGRPDFLRPMTERWVEPRFAPGPMHLTDTNAQALPNNEGVGTYKTQFLQYLKAQGLDIVMAYGNATTDIYAYAQAGMPKDKTYIIGGHAGEEGTVALPSSYTTHVETIVTPYPAATKPAPAPHGWW